MPGKIFLAVPGGGTSYPYTPADVAGSTGPLTVLGGTLTGASTPVLNLTQTWNNAATTFTGKLINITDTASNASSLLQDWQVGGVSKCKIRKDGYFTIAGAFDLGTSSSISFVSRASLRSPSDGQLQISDYNLTKSIYLNVDASHVLSMQSGSNAQEFRTYGNTTGSKYASMKHDGTNAYFVPTAGQTAFASAALATSATAGYLTIPSCAGAPTGVPASIPTGQVPFHYDSTNNKIYVYNGAWKATAALT